MPNPVYLDHNATSVLRPAVATAMTDAFRHSGNPSSIHQFGRRTRILVESAREKIAQFVNVAANQIIFTSGGTEANNTAILCANAKRVLVSAIEHDSVRTARLDAEKIPVGFDGVVDLEHLDKMLQSGGRDGVLISVMLANNETGVIQPIADIVKIAKKYGAMVHCDAVQGLGKMPIDFQSLGVDMMTISAHKIGGPSGIGALAFNNAVALQSYLKGGGQERGRRAGTENVPAIVGFGALIDDLARYMTQQVESMAYLRGKIEAAIESRQPGSVVGYESPRLPNTICAINTAMRSELQIMKLDLAGIAVSSGSACSSGRVKPSHVLGAMGYDANQSSSVLRISLGWNSTELDADEFLAAYLSLDKNPSHASLNAQPQQSSQFV